MRARYFNRTNIFGFLTHANGLSERASQAIMNSTLYDTLPLVLQWYYRYAAPNDTLKATDLIVPSFQTRLLSHGMNRCFLCRNW